MLTRSRPRVSSRYTLRALTCAAPIFLAVALVACGGSGSDPTGPSPSQDSGYPTSWEEIPFSAEYSLDGGLFLETSEVLATAVTDPDRFNMLAISRNAGGNWETTQVGYDNFALFALDAFDSDSLILVGRLGSGGTNVLVSHDAGRNWNPNTLPTREFGLLTEVRCFSSSGAVVAGDGGAWVTNDAGSTWTPIDVPAPDSEKVITVASSIAPTGSARVSLLIGWSTAAQFEPWTSVGLYEGDPSSNALSLVREFSPSSDEAIFDALEDNLLLFSRAFVEPGGLGVIFSPVFGAETPEFWRTTDGGASWRALPDPPGRIALYSGSRAVRIERDGAVYWTDDACLSWTPVSGAPQGITRFSYGRTGAAAFGEDAGGRDLIWRVAIAN